ncbi:platelet endothelial cell adhesion molecule isoform 2-T2 [Anableps anableps]
MGFLPLFTSMLLFSWTALNTALKITEVDLSIEPSATVNRSTNVTLRCKVKVLSFKNDELNRVYTIYKGERIIYSKTTNSSEDFLYSLLEARVSNNGKYKCKVNIMGEMKTSEAAMLTVTGMSTPILVLSKANVTEGESVRATCFAPDETGSLLFSFYKDSKEMDVVSGTFNTVTFIAKSVGDHAIHCSYSVFIMPNLFKSQQSKTVTLTVEELSLNPVLKISPQDNIYEGDTLKITCSVSDFEKDNQASYLLLSQGSEILKTGNTSVSVNWTAHARAPELTIECRLYVRGVEKVINKTVSVTELFSVPTLKMSPPKVFQGDSISLTCKSEILSRDRLDEEKLIYTLEPPEDPMTQQYKGVFTGIAKTIDFSYTCTAVANGIKKKSKVLTIRPKVPVSAPKIWVSGIPILGKKVEILCLSDTGTPPITYTLWKTNKQNQVATVQEFLKPANFTVLISEPGQLNEYLCRASNGDKKLQLSDKLQSTIIEPMTKAHLMVLPVSGDISEGHSVTLICSFIGTPPVTVRWFRDSHPNALETKTTNINNTNYPFVLSKEHSDKYYCKAENRANSVESNRVSLEGRVDRTPESVWSSRKPEAETDDEISTVSNEPEVEYTEVVHPRSADSTRNPLRKGTDTVYSELQNSPHGAADHHDYGSVKYVDLNRDQQPGNTQHSTEALNYSDLPAPVD